MNMRAAIFDLDDTLLPDVEAFDRALSETLRRVAPRQCGTTAMKERIRSVWRQTGLSATDCCVGVSSWEAAWTPWLDDRFPADVQQRGRSFLRDCFAGVGSGWSWQSVYRLLVENRLSECRPFGGVMEALEEISQTHKIVIVTNGSVPLQTLKLQESGIDTLCSGIEVSGQYGLLKSDPEFARRLVDRLRARGLEADFVAGDSMSSDGALAMNCGFRYVPVSRERWRERAVIDEIFRA